MAYTVIQKDTTRYVFSTNKTESGAVYYTIDTEECLFTGSSFSRRAVTKEEGNRFYLERMAKGFKRFRNAREVSWYATIPNNTPYEEEWTTSGQYLVPIRSRSIA